jgi:putative membrane protein insertion efficiency factor
VSAGRLAAQAVRGYQLILRPLLPPTCRFVPGCSEYAREALLRHGMLRGAWLAVRRVGRCHPWNPGGYDPPPGERSRG